MPSIALIHSGKSFMPEIEAYQHYFVQAGIMAKILVHPSQSDMEPYDILWFFMGIQNHLSNPNKKKIIIHEYCSASTPPLARLKDLIKNLINIKPNYRISLTPAHKGFAFPGDNIPLIIRKQGIHSSFFKKISCAKEYDFIYTGSALKVRKTDKWLHAFTEKFPGKIIMLVGNHEARIVNQFKLNPNIQFKPAVPIEALPQLLSKARYVVNYVPDIYPFNIQPSTKLLEYCAADCKIISNRYNWVNQFQDEKRAAFFFIEDDFDNLSDEALESFQFIAPDISDHRWDTIFEEMFLKKILSL